MRLLANLKSENIFSEENGRHNRHNVTLVLLIDKQSKLPNLVADMPLVSEGHLYRRSVPLLQIYISARLSYSLVAWQFGAQDYSEKDVLKSC